jgi:hypothetical protein
MHFQRPGLLEEAYPREELYPRPELLIGITIWSRGKDMIVTCVDAKVDEVYGQDSKRNG